MKFKRKKSHRMRAQTTHGWGAKKKHRGSGNRGGFGMAGTGKRADQKKPTILKLYGSSYFGKKGFKLPAKVVHKLDTINLYEIEEKVNILGKKENDTYVIDLKDKKVLGTGSLTKKVKITCAAFSKNAEAKIKKLGGEIICP